MNPYKYRNCTTGLAENCKFIWYSKTCVKQPPSKRPKIGFQDQLLLNAGQKYFRMLQGEHSAIRPSLSYQFSLRYLFCLFLSGRFTQVLLYPQLINQLSVCLYEHVHLLNNLWYTETINCTVKQPLSKRLKIVFKNCLMQVKSIGECSKGSILQYFWSLFSYHLSLRSLFCLFLSGHFTQALLYLQLINLPSVCL